MRRKTRAITLLLASSVVVAGCSAAQNTRRVNYVTLEDCQAQWGAGDEKCRVERDGVYGPHYIFSGGHAIYYPYTDRGEVSTKPIDAPPTARFSPQGEVIGKGIRSIHTTSVIRGGFGRLGGLFGHRGAS